MDEFKKVVLKQVILAERETIRLKETAALVSEHDERARNTIANKYEGEIIRLKRELESLSQANQRLQAQLRKGSVLQTMVKNALERHRSWSEGETGAEGIASRGSDVGGKDSVEPQ